MADEGLTGPITSFIEQYVFAVEQLEIMILLQSNPGTSYTVQEVYDVILSTRPSVQSWLEGMVTQGLAAQTANDPPAFTFAPQQDVIREGMQALGEAYRAFPVRVIQAIYHRARPPQNDPAQSFANAFRFRPD